MTDSLYVELDELTRKLDESIKDMRITGQKMAQAERDYKVLLRKYSLALKMDGMAIGMIQLTVRGIPEVADARMERDIADAFYQASKEVVMATKLKMRLVESQLQREYSTPQAAY